METKEVTGYKWATLEEFEAACAGMDYIVGVPKDDESITRNSATAEINFDENFEPIFYFVYWDATGCPELMNPPEVFTVNVFTP